MTNDFYQPIQLFRQNALTRKRSITTPRSQSSALSCESRSSWLLQSQLDNTKQLDKACSLDSLAIASNYWKIPDDNLYLTSMAINNDSINPLLAVSSGSKTDNLYIYDINMQENYLTHHNTISLSHIYSMKWLDKKSYNDPNLLLTGNKKGYAHLTLIPNSQELDASAEIVKRFNHQKHLAGDSVRSRVLDTPPISPVLAYSSSLVTNVDTAPKTWRNSPNNSIFTLYKEHIFNWDSTKSRSPILKINSHGTVMFDAAPQREAILALSGTYGVALHDLRCGDRGTLLAPQVSGASLANYVKWAPYDANVLAASYADGVARLWDIRNRSAPFAELDGHTDTISSVEWSEENACDLYTAGRDGNIVHWDLSVDGACRSTLQKCSLSVGFAAVMADSRSDTIVGKRQCGTVIPASSSGIVQLGTIYNQSGSKLLSIDGSSFLGVHCKSSENSTVLNRGGSGSENGATASWSTEEVDYSVVDQSSEGLTVSKHRLAIPELEEDLSSIFSLAASPTHTRSSSNTPSLPSIQEDSSAEEEALDEMLDLMIQRTMEHDKSSFGLPTQIVDEFTFHQPPPILPQKIQYGRSHSLSDQYSSDGDSHAHSPSFSHGTLTPQTSMESLALNNYRTATGDTLGHTRPAFSDSTKAPHSENSLHYPEGILPVIPTPALV
ncbi:hypothetical protein BABINDRAFT_63900 [Babjeviella inositovora NRRL Y-12698]|uniref:Uncharacterized protein n=1 Tax=Babjeviella inositovora NRRL Y-12698 TaxID=984486 RepID=A0A1E3QN70_9ASCO|nr:uncharacterized protein BABINDRAFT_63900 [Babjeviella inositovora NRRL Y-12698]ODQ79156.1 hypothetical protein BABINDRAFT_63900 [Babjeviella inositovora NRRL Y-12698]